jgi:hypothetical protein
MGVEGGHSGWDSDVELVEVFIVAAPREDFAVGGEDDAGDLIDGPGGAMVAGNPLGCCERDGAGFDWNINFGMVELARGFGEVRCDLDGSLLGLGDAGRAEGEQS